MHMNKFIVGLISVMIFSPLAVGDLAQAQSAEQRGLEIATAMDEWNSGFADVTAELRMILLDQNGNRAERKLQSSRLEVANDGDKVLLVFQAPADIRNTALLSHTHSLRANDQWLYLPSLKRIKRISSKNKSGPFVGSEFAFEDLSSQEVDKYTYKLLGTDRCEQFRCYVLERYPAYEHSGYARQIIWVEPDEYRVFKTAFYDRKNALLKTLVFEGYQKYLGRYWKPSTMTMTNHQTKKSTILEWSDYQFKTGLQDRDFIKDKLTR